MFKFVLSRKYIIHILRHCKIKNIFVKQKQQKKMSTHIHTRARARTRTGVPISVPVVPVYPRQTQI
jgi:hypothetical protein